MSIRPRFRCLAYLSWVAVGSLLFLPATAQTFPPGNKKCCPHGLPSKGSLLVFEPDEFPPRPKGFSPPSHLEWKETSPRLTDADRDEFLSTALRNGVVTKLLGARYLLIAIGYLDSERDKKPELSTEPDVGLLFYSYSQGSTVLVEMRGRKMAYARVVPDFEPAVTPEEVRQAVKLARADQRSGLIRGDLEGRGILAEDSENRPRHRLVYVSFSPPNSHRPVFSALVDLTALRVLELRPVAETKPALKGR